ncbi:S8 family serine peptidase [Streptomyces sp. NPDC058695]|uniref:S8 family serine peptidase n=1 Tax=Streptomyces sp. NPDC058695 TaxID=3346604 RepID=UPI00364CA703
MTAVQAAALKTDPTVRFVASGGTFRRGPLSPEKPARCKGSSGDVGQCLPDWAGRINAERSSTRSGDGRGSVDVNVAVLDDGIAADQPDLNVQGGVDCLTGSPVTPGNSLSDPGGHGTAVAGVVGAKDNDIGVVGVAPGTPLQSVKVLDDNGDGSTASVLCGIDWVASTRTDNDPANDIAVANMSLSGPGTDDRSCGTVNQDVLHFGVCNLVRAGVTLVANAGNEHYDFSGSIPASYDEVLTATAMADFDGQPGGKAAPDCYGQDFGLLGDADDEAVLGLSNFAKSRADSRHTVSAPGSCVETTYLPPSRFAIVSGTSFSAPAVAGVTALCIAKGRCGASTPARNLRTIVSDAKKYNHANPRYGFFGDPRRPIPGRYYGDLVSADRY